MNEGRPGGRSLPPSEKGNPLAVAVRMAVLTGTFGEVPTSINKKLWRDAISMLELPTTVPLVKEVALIGLQVTGSILAPMLFAVGANAQQGNETINDYLQPAAPTCYPPVWVAGMHTRVGLSGFRKYISRSKEIANLLEASATGNISKSKIVGALVFRLDCGQLKRRLDWPLARELKKRATSLGWGLDDGAVPDALKIIEAEFHLINDCRAAAMREYFS